MVQRDRVLEGRMRPDHLGQGRTGGVGYHQQHPGTARGIYREDTHHASQVTILKP